MLWKKWPYWLRGAVIAVVSGLLLELVLRFSPPEIQDSFIADILDALVGGPVTMLFYPLMSLALEGAIQSPSNALIMAGCFFFAKKSVVWFGVCSGMCFLEQRGEE